MQRVHFLLFPCEGDAAIDILMAYASHSTSGQVVNVHALVEL